MQSIPKSAHKYLTRQKSYKNSTFLPWRKHLTLGVLLHRPHARFIILIGAILAAVFGLIPPFFQKTFIDLLTGHRTFEIGFLEGLNPSWKLVATILLAFFGMLIAQMFAVILKVFCAREGGILYGQLANDVYVHAIRLTGQARSSKTIGEMVAIFTQDVAAAVSLVEEFIPSLLSSFIPIVVAPIAIQFSFDLPVRDIFMALLFSSLSLLALSYRQSFFFAAFKRLAGERLAVVNEWLQNMRMIRILGWQTLFEKKIKTKRIEETKNRLGMVTNGSTMNAIAQVAPLIINVVAISVLIRTRAQKFSPGDIFAMLWVFAVFLARPIRNLPWTVVIFLDGYTSCKRLARFFKLSTEPSEKNYPASPKSKHLETGPGIHVQGLTLQLGDKAILRDINFRAEPGEFVAIVGEVGSGKTQFLLSLLRDTPCSFDKYTINGIDVLKEELFETRRQFSYVPQDCFTMSSSIRDNVTFSYGSNSANDPSVLESLKNAQFDLETEHLTEGLDSEIGERGVNLSGGQRQRVAIARAHYHKKDILLLDDPLSAVDIDTEAKLIETLITGEWRGKTRILVTHRLTVLPYADRVYVMEKGRMRLQHGSK